MNKEKLRRFVAKGTMTYVAVFALVLMVSPYFHVFPVYFLAFPGDP